MTILHAQFLVHWAGKEFHKPLTAPLDDNLRKEYVDTLIGILEKGFKMLHRREEIYDLDGKVLEAFISRVCFTEIKLSLAKEHAGRYGYLGIAVDRDFVLERYGNPVFYINSGKSNVAVNANKVLEFLQRDPKYKDILAEYRTLLAYFKNMNDRGCNDLKYYDELEWRVAHLNRLESEGRIAVVDRAKYEYMLKLNPSDVKVLVFPDDETRKLAFERPGLSELLDSPICLTINDCENF